MAVRAILIAGPTASGKSALALRLAERLGGAIVNADSMQVYRDLRLLTARPGPADEARAPHRLYGHVDAGEAYSVGRWLGDAGRVLGKAGERPPIVVGGTGLYFKALLEGLSAIPPVPEAVRAEVRAMAAAEPAERLHAALAARDPLTAARLEVGDRQRVARALEVLAATGRPLAGFLAAREAPLLDPAACVRLFLAPDREALKRRIDARFDAMLDLGALEEVQALRRRGLDPALPAMRAHGVPWLMQALDDRMALTEAIARAKADTRRYAKRQLTWFRHQGEGWTWAPPEQAEPVALAALGG